MLKQELPKILNQLTDESLLQKVTSKNWTLGRIAWHTVTAIGVIASRTDLSFDSPNQDYPVPTSAKFISDSYRQASSALSQAVKNNGMIRVLGKYRSFLDRECQIQTFYFL